MNDDTGEAGAGLGVHDGFPNPATDKSLRALDLNQLLIRQPASTFLFRVRGAEWERAGIFDGDIALIDRALAPRAGDQVVWWREQGEGFAISNLRDVDAGTAVWGVVTAVIHQFRRDLLGQKPARKAGGL